MSFGTLALIGLCGFAGPLLAAGSRGAVPVVVGELLAGILLGHTGLNAIDTKDATLSFLSDIGFAMLMFAVGMGVPLRQLGLRESLRTGATTAAIVAGLAVAAGLLVSRIGEAGHPALYAVLIASGSAAVVLPILQERGLQGPTALAVTAQVTVADIGAMVAVPLVLAPARTGRVVIGSLIMAGCVLAILVAARHLRHRSEVHRLRELGKRRGWAVDLRLALIVLFGLAWSTEHSGASLLIAGFGAGLMVASIGGPKRLSNEVLGIAGGFFIPLFFVVLGARLDMRGMFSDPALIALVGTLAALNVVVHLLAARIVRQPRAAGLVSCAQLGVPAALVALGLPAHVLTGTQAAAIVVAALLSIVACSVGALGLEAERRGAQ
ncbi:MAG TPA: cation:proton antiporter, partial [Solirubrobacteraceae bacterium]|jgi:Kef-type K+ transport system membrane component KefB|nr:cation:proton antiporter [Solirubrobacteraceae bacterium]